MSGVTKSFPYVPLWDLTIKLVRIALESSVANYHAADRLVEHFSEAGLPYPNLFCEELVGGSADSPLYGSPAELLRTLQPQLEKMRIVPAETIAMEGLESRLREAVIQARSADLWTCADLRLGAALNSACFETYAQLYRHKLITLYNQPGAKQTLTVTIPH